MFGELRERIRDHARDKLCEDLQALGIQAQMSERGRPQEKILPIRQRSLGVIDIVEGPIRWIHVTHVARVNMAPYSYRTLMYGVPDPKVRSGYPEVRLIAKSFEEGPVSRWWQRNVGGQSNVGIDKVRWEGKDFGLRLIDRLSDDVSLNKPIIVCKDELEIAADSEHNCWIVTVSTVYTRKQASPSKDMWDCYQSIASHLMGTPLPPNT